MRIKGTIDDFRAIMKRLYDLNGCGCWVSSNDDDLQFGECTEADSPPGCATWEVFHWPRDDRGELAQGRQCYAAIEVYDYSRGYIDIEPLDGYRPKSGRWRPIGALFDEFYNWVMDEVQLAMPDQDAAESGTGRPGGRPRNADDDWAYQEIRNGRDNSEVCREWLQRIPESRKTGLADPMDSFNQAMRYRRKRENRE